MSYTYAQRKKAGASRQSPAPERMEALKSGTVKPSAAEMGHRVDLPEAMRAKMEASFGADLSAVKLYESQAVADAGANAVAQGGSIAFAPGKADFTSMSGQALLGHELSHVVSQARGEVTGGGFLNDRALEARADREGAMAARGESVFGGAVAPLSTATAAPAAGPMQADRKGDQKKNADRMEAIYAGNHGNKDTVVSKKDQAWYDKQINSGNLGLAQELQRRQVAYSQQALDKVGAQEGDRAENAKQYLVNGMDTSRSNVMDILSAMKLSDKNRAALETGLSDADRTTIQQAKDLRTEGTDAMDRMGNAAVNAKFRREMYELPMQINTQLANVSKANKYFDKSKKKWWV